MRFAQTSSRFTALGLGVTLAFALTGVAIAAPNEAPEIPKKATATVNPVTYQQALEGLPAASKALSDASSRLILAQDALDGLEDRNSTALARISAARMALTQAEQAHTEAMSTAETTQKNIDELARHMYIEGGDPSVVEAILNADEPDSVARVVETGQAVKELSNERISENDSAQSHLLAAGDALQSAHAEYTQAENDGAQIAVEYQNALKARDTAQTEHDQAQAHYQELWAITSQDPSDGYGDVKQCGDWLVRALYRAGFRGENLREAWSIAMRESGGNEKSVSSTQDHGIFQFNKPSWGHTEIWGSDELMLTREWNIAKAFEISDGGRTWYPWGLDGHGRTNAQAYINAGWDAAKIDSHITQPYLKWYALYPCKAAE